MNRRYTAPLTVLAAAPLLLYACDATDNAYRAVGELASDRIEIAAEVSEPIVEIYAAEGEAVSRGQVLVRQDTARAELRLSELEAALSQQQARLDELVRGPRREQIAAARAGVEGTAQELSFRQAELRRVRDVHARGLASEEQLDSANAALDAAKANHKVTLAQLEERLAGTTIEELEQAEQAVNQAKARRDSALIDLERHDLTAPDAGILDSRILEIGERPAAGQTVVVVLGGEQPYARVYVPEALRVHVRPGIKALIHVDGMDTAIDGRVRWVSSDPAFTPYYALTERDRGRLSYVAKIDIAGQRERLPDGVPVDVEFLIDKGP